MKRGTEGGDKVAGPMFPRLHVNEIDRKGPRAPPRNKMALYEQLSLPSQRFIHARPHRNPDSTTADSVLPSSQVNRSEKGMLFSQHLPPKHHSEKQYSQHYDLSAPSTHVDKRNELYEEDFRVPIIHTDTKSELVACQDEAVPNSRSIDRAEVEQKQADSLPCHQTGGNPANSVERLKSDDNAHEELCSESQFSSNTHATSVLAENIISTSGKNGSFPAMKVLIFDKNCYEDGACMPAEVVNLEIGDSVSETSIACSITGQNITPDDVVGVIGQKRFWTARKSIADQQRLFADQVFELHRLIKVQRSIATSSHFSLDNDTDAAKSKKFSPRKEPPLDYPMKALPKHPKQKQNSKNPSHEDCSTENTFGESNLASLENTTLPSKHEPTGNNPSYPPGTTPLCLNQPNVSQWLIPMLSPSEGLVYKPYPLPGSSVFPSCGVWGLPGSNMAPINHFSTQYPQYQFPYFHPTGPHPYFPAFIDSNQFYRPDQEVQASTTSRPSERTQGSETGNAGEGRNELELVPEPEAPARVIKVVPHKAGSVTESVARIFQSIQEERSQHSFI